MEPCGEHYPEDGEEPERDRRDGADDAGQRLFEHGREHDADAGHERDDTERYEDTENRHRRRVVVLIREKCQERGIQRDDTDRGQRRRYPERERCRDFREHTHISSRPPPP